MFNLDGLKFSALLDGVHPAVKAHRVSWQTALDAYDGEGGFLDGSYLWEFPRENDSEWRARKAQARYHNIAATLVDYYVRKVCAEISREAKSETLTAWWANVDGAGTDATTYMRHALAKALSAGHVGILSDKTMDQPNGPRKVDERAAVFLTRFLPTAMLDWRLERDEGLRAIKLLEDVESESLLAETRTTQRLLLWDVEEWVRVVPSDDDEGDATVQDRGQHGLGRVPLVVLRPFRSARWAFIGRPLVESSVLRALYNRSSEQDTVLRDQAFSVFVMEVGPDGDVEKAKQFLGNEIGATRALFAIGPSDYKTPSMDVPATLETHQAFLVKELYRLAHVPMDTGSREAQSAEAIRLQHEALQAVLTGVAQECRRVELELAKLYFAWTSATPDVAARAFEAADVQIAYPETFFETDPQKDLETLITAMRGVSSPTFEKHVQKQMVSVVAPSLDEKTRETINDEIDASESQQAQQAGVDQNSLRQGAEARLASFVSQAQQGEVAA